MKVADNTAQGVAETAFEYYRFQGVKGFDYVNVERLCYLNPFDPNNRISTLRFIRIKQIQTLEKMYVGLFRDGQRYADYWVEIIAKYKSDAENLMKANFNFNYENVYPAQEIFPYIFENRERFKLGRLAEYDLLTDHKVWRKING